jgi:hypothetical protein
MKRFNEKISFLVTLEVPPGATISMLREYIETELRAGCGARHPDDPIHDLNRDSVTVRRAGS